MEKKFNRIDEILKSKGITQTWLASQLGVSKNAVNMICRNKTQPHLETLFKIAALLERDVCDLLDRSKSDATASEATAEKS